MSFIALLTLVAVASVLDLVEPLPRPLSLPCTKLAGPLCGTDGVTYKNINELTRAAKTQRLLDLNVSHFGPCLEQSLSHIKVSRNSKVAVTKKHKHLNYYPKGGISINNNAVNNNDLKGKRGIHQIKINNNAQNDNNIGENDDLYFDKPIESYDDKDLEIIDPNNNDVPNYNDGADDSNVIDESDVENENNDNSNQESWNQIIKHLIKKKKIIKQIDSDNDDWIPIFDGDNGVKHQESDLEIIDYVVPISIGTKKNRKETNEGTIITVNTNSEYGGCGSYLGSSSGENIPMTISEYVNNV